MIAVNFKALALFSLLFGVGLAIQFDRLSARPRRWALLARRLLALLLVGVAHLVLIWNGDILVEYAIAGLFVLAFLAGPRHWCAVVGIGLLAIYIVLPPLIAFPSKAWLTAATAEATRVYSTGTFGEIFGLRMRELSGLLSLHVAVFPRTLGLMLLGAALWRAGVTRSNSSASEWLPWVAAIAIPVGLLMTMLHATGAMHGSWQALISFERSAALILAFGYGAAILWGAAQVSWQRWLAWAQPIGQMAVTNYLAQSVFFGLVFYGYGLGLFGKLGVSKAFTIAVVVYAIQGVFSRFWLQRFRFGPVEWLWRSATYWSWQPFNREPNDVGKVGSSGRV